MEAQPFDVPPPSIEPTGPPLLPGPLVDLFLRPSRFFSSHLALGATPYVVFVTFVCGVSYSIGRLDKQMVKIDLGKRGSGLATLGLLDSWPLLWGFLLGVGALSALFLWWLGGWWYTVRVKWSGDRHVDPFRSRLVYIYSSFVYALPAVLAVVAATFLYADYQEYWQADEVWSTLVVVFLVWSCVTSYRGVRTMFAVSPWKARVWFLVLPVTVYVGALLVVGAIYAMRELG